MIISFSKFLFIKKVFVYFFNVQNNNNWLKAREIGSCLYNSFSVFWSKFPLPLL